MAIFHSVYEGPPGHDGMTARLLVAEPLPRLTSLTPPLASADGGGLLLEQPDPPKGVGGEATAFEGCGEEEEEGALRVPCEAIHIEFGVCPL